MYRCITAAIVVEPDRYSVRVQRVCAAQRTYHTERHQAWLEVYTGQPAATARRYDGGGTAAA